jgi:2'-5' RNA ligase
MPSAVIVRAHLPPGLAHLRQTHVTDAAEGVPAHVTLLYPFVPWDELDPSVGRKIASVAARHPAFDYTMTGPGRWPDTIYVAVEPLEPFVRLQADLAATFPEYPIYGGASDFEFNPHITVAEGRAAADADTFADAAWVALPVAARAAWLDVIAGDGGKWDLVWRVPLGRSDGSAIATIRP